MRAKTITTILATMAALLACALPASAAGPKTVHQPAQVSVQLAGAATHGFHFYAFSVEQGEVVLFHKQLHGDGEESVFYSSFHRHPAPGLDQGRLDIKIARLGHFRGRFVATSTKTVKLEKGCTGEPTIVEEGHFVGSFVFHGERGYTAIEAPREQGEITRQGATDCRIPPTRPAHHNHNSKAIEEKMEKAAEEDEFRLIAGDPKAELLFQATREQVPSGPESGATTTFEATADGRAGAFAIGRSVSIFDHEKDPASTFLTPNLAEPLAEATLAPPAPFSGSATFHLEGPRKASWTGDLAVELPGAGKVPLTGKKVYAATCKGRKNCTKTLPKLLSELAVLGFGESVGLEEGSRGAELQTIS